MEDSLDAGGDTDPATNAEETKTTVGGKRKAKGPVSSALRYILSCLRNTSILTVCH